jgi:hypothetical protein
VETYAVDVDPKQIVRWLMNEERQRGSDLLVTVTRTYWRRALGPQDDSRLGDAERDDLGESAEVGLVEVRPRHQPSLWTLRIRVADDIGPALPEDEPVPDGEEEIDLATFYADFIKADRGLAEVSAEAESAGAKGSLTRVLEAMRENRHEK